MPAVNTTNNRCVRLTTTNGTATVGANYTTKQNAAYLVTLKAVATDGSTTASYMRIATFENNAGTLGQVGTTTSVHTNEDIAAPMDVSFAVSGQDINVMVTGDPGRNIKWNLVVDVDPAYVNE